jgi:hypothetical protein
MATTHSEQDIQLLQDLAAKWLQWDLNPENRKEIQTLLDKKDWPELDKRLRNRIAFGTAGNLSPTFIFLMLMLFSV